MALVLPNSVFFHVPKSGGTFVRKTLIDLGIPHEELGRPHENAIDFARRYPDIIKNKYSFTFVRHPLTWWQSYWAHRHKNGWSLEHPMDRVCNDIDFNGYMEQVLSCEWQSHYLDICQRFVTEDVRFIGRQENLVADLETALVQANEECDLNRLGRLGVINQSPSETALYSPGIKKRVLSLHHELIEKFYPE